MSKIETAAKLFFGEKGKRKARLVVGAIASLALLGYCNYDGEGAAAKKQPVALGALGKQTLKEHANIRDESNGKVCARTTKKVTGITLFEGAVVGSDLSRFAVSRSELVNTGAIPPDNTCPEKSWVDRIYLPKLPEVVLTVPPAPQPSHRQ